MCNFKRYFSLFLLTAFLSFNSAYFNNAYCMPTNLYDEVELENIQQVLLNGKFSVEKQNRQELEKIIRSIEAYRKQSENQDAFWGLYGYILSKNRGLARRLEPELVHPPKPVESKLLEQKKEVSQNILHPKERLAQNKREHFYKIVHCWSRHRGSKYLPIGRF